MPSASVCMSIAWVLLVMFFAIVVQISDVKRKQLAIFLKRFN